MERELQITMRGMERSSAVDHDIERNVKHLERFHDHITGCHVTVEAPHQHGRKGQLYSVKVEVRVPGGEVIASHERRQDHAHEDVHVAIRDAFDAVIRRVEDHVRKQRGAVKAREVPAHGRVVKLFPIEGYGFLETADGLQVYFHERSVSHGAYEALAVGDEVRFVMAPTESEKGPQASTVTALGKHHVVG